MIAQTSRGALLASAMSTPTAARLQSFLATSDGQTPNTTSWPRPRRPHPRPCRSAQRWLRADAHHEDGKQGAGARCL